MNSKMSVTQVATIVLVLVTMILTFELGCSGPTLTPAPTPTQSPKPTQAPPPTPTGSPAPPRVLKNVKIGSASIGGTMYNYGDALAKVWGKTLNISAENSPTGGSVENMRLVHNGEIDAGLTTARFAGYARLATEVFSKEKPYTDLRALASVYSYTYVIIALKSSGITKVTDLAGKNVKFGAGPSPATWDPLSKPIFDAHGIDYQKGLNKIYASIEDLFRMLGEGRLDCMVIGVAGMEPPAGYLELASARPIVIVEQDVDRMRMANNALALIPKGAVPGAEKDTYNYSLGAVLLVATNRMSEDSAYLLAKSLHENLKDISAICPTAKEAIVNPAILASDAPIPYHVGAARYWEQVGLLGK